MEAIYEPCGIYKKYSIIVANTNEQTARAAGTTPRFQATVLGWKTDCNGWEVLEMGPTCASSHLALDELLLEIGYDLWDSFILHVRKVSSIIHCPLVLKQKTYLRYNKKSCERTGNNIALSVLKMA